MSGAVRAVAARAALLRGALARGAGRLRAMPRPAPPAGHGARVLLALLLAAADGRGGRGARRAPRRGGGRGGRRDRVRGRARRRRHRPAVRPLRVLRAARPAGGRRPAARRGGVGDDGAAGVGRRPAGDAGAGARVPLAAGGAHGVGRLPRPAHGARGLLDAGPAAGATRACPRRTSPAGSRPGSAVFARVSRRSTREPPDARDDGALAALRLDVGRRDVRERGALAAAARRPPPAAAAMGAFAVPGAAARARA